MPQAALSNNTPSAQRYVLGEDEFVQVHLRDRKVSARQNVNIFCNEAPIKSSSSFVSMYCALRKGVLSVALVN